MFDNFPDVLTVGQFRTALPVNRNKAYALLADGTIPSFRLGRNIYIPKADLIDFITNQTCGGNARQVEQENTPND